ncbi:CpsD/CapB family tyrosine-protein kinase [Marimonas arenosa]|uniref:CpsD/CapB family tyrosine-protein kinase n=1 Tax=Marimonas arenosa TaxID=1795305 RepID=A0AAE4B3K9_9RHOB|nr:CpsD/CapB family tyrosine-protein kinase [Marimonas arenosa]MDQ2089347.1 CpsD/CapB family tyrosine-protein kinase [Marimonas arenosa]
MSDRPRFTRKSRPRLDKAERDRLIAEIAGQTADETATFDLPHVADTPDEDAETREREREEIWEPTDGADPVFDSFEDADFLSVTETEGTISEPTTAAHEVFGEADEAAIEDTFQPEAATDFPTAAPLQDDSAPASLSDALALLARELDSKPRAPKPETGPTEQDAEPPVTDASEPPETEPPDTEPDAEARPAQTDDTAPDVAPVPVSPPPSEPLSPDAVWASLASIPVDPGHLARNLIITAGRHDPAHGAFDVLRTRLVQTLHDNDWKRVAVTSPTRDSGKTFTAVNLAISLSRYEAMRTVLMDMDMRNPSLADVLGAPDPGAMGDFLQGKTSVSEHFVRLGRNALNIGTNLAVGLNSRVEAYASELMQDPLTDATFDRMMAELDPDVVLYDLPPALAYDDVIAFKKHFDGVLMVVGGGTTTADEVREAMRRLGEDVPLLGVVLNQAETESGQGYSYDY